MKNSTGTLPKENEYEKADKIKYEEIKGELEKIEKGEICLLGVLNEEYEEGNKIAEILIGLCIVAEGEYQDDSKCTDQRCFV